MIATICSQAYEDKYIRKYTLGLTIYTPSYWQAKAKAKCIISVCKIISAILEIIILFLIAAVATALFNDSYPYLSNRIIDLLIKLKINTLPASLITKIISPIIVGLIPLFIEGGAFLINEWIS